MPADAHPLGREGTDLAFGTPYEQDGAGVITATATRGHRLAGRPHSGSDGHALDAELSRSHPMGAFVIRHGKARWHPALDVTKVVTTAEWVVGGVLVARQLAARPSTAKAAVVMGPGGWVSMKGGAMAVRPARRGWRRAHPSATPTRARRPWWARLLAATTLESLVG